MMEKILFGPVEILPPTPVDRAVLEIEGVPVSATPCTTYVFLDEVHGDAIEELIRTRNYAGSFSISSHSSEALQLDITGALNTALKIRPNFHISVLTPCAVGHDAPVFGFKQLRIHRTPAMDAFPVTHPYSRNHFSKRAREKAR
jgi:hypothetical protein